MPYVFSTATHSIEIIQWDMPDNRKILPRRIRSFTIKGGANVANKFVQTPRGVATRVENEQLEWLIKQPAFQTGVAKGFFTWDKSESSLKAALTSMEVGDKSRPLTDADYRQGGRRSDTEAGAPKVTSAEISPAAV